ncbi:MAG TPA: leucine-rich repeat domain-containing protein [Verrucomicrobiae bacterium]|nr:leucine-rich repeat domain-containing protein [Verrucomicrobiae bacterium]
MKTKILVLFLSLANFIANGQVNYTNLYGASYAEVTLSPNASGDIDIVSTYNGYPVRSIETGAFEYCDGLTSVIIPDSVTGIGGEAFLGCTSLTNVIIPNSVTYIGGDAFDYCTSLTSVDLPNSVTILASSIFYHAGLTSIAFPESATNIGSGVCTSCVDLRSAVISCPDTGGGTFSACTALTDVTFGPNVRNIGSYAFSSCSSLTSVVIPNSVTNIDSRAFNVCSGLANVVFGVNVRNIGSYAFLGCNNLTRVVIPASVTNIGDYAFFNCAKLTNITFLGNAPALGVNVFTNVPGIVYYQPRKSGWGATYGGLPAVMLTPPQIASSGLQSGDFTFTITGLINETVVIEASTDLVTWEPIYTNALDATNVLFSDPHWTDYPTRFYRAFDPSMVGN